jgi:DNA-binding transcriptional regulator YbjK
VEQVKARGRAREEILRAALRLIGERGLHAVTHRDVAAAAGVSPGSTTYHFSSLEDLVTAALELFVEDEVARVEAATAGLAGAGPEQVLDAVAAQIDLTLSRPAEQIAQFELYLEATRQPQLAAAAARCVAAYRRATTAALRSAGAADPEGLAPIALALIDGLLLQQLADPRDDYVEMVLKPALRRIVEIAG